MKINKKVWPEYFQEIIDGNKTFEVRLADWKCKPSDILVLQEWDPKTNNYTGRVVEKKVTYVFKNKEQKFWSKKDVAKHGFQIIALK